MDGWVDGLEYAGGREKKKNRRKHQCLDRWEGRKTGVGRYDRKICRRCRRDG